jgi:serine phosphatase RsbU (regulator of sigma subunit)
MIRCFTRNFREAVVVAASGEMTPGSGLPVYALLDSLAESVLIVTPVRGRGGCLADFAIKHLSPGYVDPAGRPAAKICGQTLLQAYPDSQARAGLFAVARQVLADGQPVELAGHAGPLTGTVDTTPVADLRAVRHDDHVLFTWRRPGGGDSRLAELLDHVQRIGQLGGWEENLARGTVHWTDAAFTVFGLDPEYAEAIPLTELHSYVLAADRPLVRRFRQSLLRQREPAAAVFRIVRPEDGAVRQIRVFAEPVLTPAGVTALRGAFQDVSALYHTQVALAATRTQLADSEQRAAEEHDLAVRLQRALMPPARQEDAAGIDIAVRYRPAEAGYLVAGDWYDMLRMPGGDLMIVVGDIVGHGIEAVTGMVTARNALRGLAVSGKDPGELLRQLNWAACTFTEGITGTAIVGRYNPQTRVLRWARGGHLPPILVRGGVATVQPASDGLLIGVVADADYEDVDLQLESGDALLLYTDGLIERRATSISDALAEFAAVAVPVGADADSYAERIMAGAASDTDDDACLVVIKIL